MYVIKNFLVVASLFVLLTGCSSSVDERISDYLNNGEFEDALSWLTEELEDNPDDSYLNYMAARVVLAKCQKDRCFDHNSTYLQPLQRYIERITTFSVEDDGQLIDLYAQFSDLLTGLSQGRNHPVALVSLLQYLPKHEFKTLTLSLMASRGLEHIEKGEIAAAVSLFEGLGKYIDPSDPNKYIAQLIYGYAMHDQDIIKKTRTQLQSADEQLAVGQIYLKALPYAVHQYMQEERSHAGTLAFLSGFRAILNNINIAYLRQPEGRAEVANAVYAMSRNPVFMNHAASNLALQEDQKNVQDEETIAVEEVNAPPKIIESKIPDAEVEPESFTEESMEEVKLRVFKLALLINPSSERSWQQFLEPATAFAIKTQRPEILFGQLSPQDVPTEIIGQYNTSLFKIFEDNIEKSKSILGLVQHVILPAKGSDTVKLQVADLLNKAMIKAVDDENYDLVYEYASFQPDVAKLSRQKIVSITLDALEKKWNRSEFAGMDVLAQFLSKTMNIDFSLDSFLLQSFDDHLSKMGVQKKLNADTPDNLLKAESDVRIDLGEKFEFLQSQFKGQPDVLDNMLKNLVVKAEGVYGVPNALYLLNGYFSENFSREERQEYLEGAVRNSLQKDDSLNALDFAHTASRLNEKFSDVSMLFAVNEALKRTDDLEDIRHLWERAPEKFIVAMKETRPQYVTLMRAIEAYEEGDHQSAAAMFTVLSDSSLIQIARPYLSEYIETVNEHAGVYATSSGEGNDDMNTQFIRIDLATSSLEESDVQVDTDLLAVNLSFVNALGTIKREEKSSLSENYGTVISFDTKGRINPNTMEITIPDAEKSSTSFLTSFEKVYGNVKALSLEKNGLRLITDNNVYRFSKVSDDPKEIFFPQGRFSMVRVVSDVSGGMDYILPKGAILELYVDEERKILRGSADNQKEYYLVTGSLMHPADSKPQEVKGFYEPVTSVASLAYKYPFPSGGKLDAQVKCQLAGHYILCAGHNKHWERQKYSYTISGRQIQPEYTKFSHPRLQNRTEQEAYQPTGVRNRP